MSFDLLRVLSGIPPQSFNEGNRSSFKERAADYFSGFNRGYREGVRDESRFEQSLGRGGFPGFPSSGDGQRCGDRSDSHGRRPDYANADCSSGIDRTPSATSRGRPLTGKMDGPDAAVMTTPGGYSIRASANPADQGGTLEITGPGPDFKKTKIWGDPHVETDTDGTGPGGYTKNFDFKGNMSVMLPDGTEVKMATVPTRDGSQSFLSSVQVINGAVGMQVSSMNEGSGKLQLNKGNGALLDAMGSHGATVGWNQNNDGQYGASNGFGGNDRRVDQAWIDSSERNPGSGLHEAATALSPYEAGYGSGNYGNYSGNGSLNGPGHQTHRHPHHGSRPIHDGYVVGA
jgi:hypothetical protein